jgi:hypothetical protein
MSSSSLSSRFINKFRSGNLRGRLPINTPSMKKATSFIEMEAVSTCKNKVKGHFIFKDDEN